MPLWKQIFSSLDYLKIFCSPFSDVGFSQLFSRYTTPKSEKEEFSYKETRAPSSVSIKPYEYTEVPDVKQFFEASNFRKLVSILRRVEITKIES